MVAIQGWDLFAHPLLLDQLDKLVAAVEREKAKKPLPLFRRLTPNQRA